MMNQQNQLLCYLCHKELDSSQKETFYHIGTKRTVCRSCGDSFLEKANHVSPWVIQKVTLQDETMVLVKRKKN